MARKEEIVIKKMWIYDPHPGGVKIPEPVRQRTGDQVFVPARRKVMFKPGRILRETLSRPREVNKEKWSGESRAAFLSTEPRFEFPVFLAQERLVRARPQTGFVYGQCQVFLSALYGHF